MNPRKWYILGQITGYIIMMIFVTILSGYVLSQLWGWFIVPIFHIQNISIGGAVSLVYIVNYLKGYNITNKTAKQIVTEGITWNIAALIIGWMLHIVIVR